MLKCIFISIQPSIHFFTCARVHPCFEQHCCSASTKDFLYFQGGMTGTVRRIWDLFDFFNLFIFLSFGFCCFLVQFRYFVFLLPLTSVNLLSGFTVSPAPSLVPNQYSALVSPLSSLIQLVIYTVSCHQLTSDSLFLDSCQTFRSSFLCSPVFSPSCY